MSTIHDEAWNGTLSLTSLKASLPKDPSIIDREGGSKKVTPLAAACWGGHRDVVSLLLDNKANPNALSPHSRTPLFFATARTPPPDRAEIVKVLLDAHADINLPCDGDRNTPLMNAIVQSRDKDVIHLLVDGGASLMLQNARNETAESLAKQYGMESHLRPKEERNTTRAQVVDGVMSLVMHIISYVNTSSIATVAGGIVSQLYHLKGITSPDLTKEIPAPKTVAEFKSNLNNYIKGKTFEKFFARDDPFLQTLAERASALTNDPSTDLGKPENINHLTRLSLYQPVIYCDDSSSMNTNNRYGNLKELVIRIARIATKIVPDDYAGVELHFINSPSSHKLDAKAIEGAIDQVKPGGRTNIGTQLRSKILEPLVYNVIPTKTISNPIPLKRPLLVCAITDGIPEPEPVDTLKKAIVECKKTLVNADYEPTAVMFSISQIGDDKKATAFLNGLGGDVRLKEVLYCTAETLDSEFKKFEANERQLESWLLHMLMGPIMMAKEE